jgi:hypothetical protein
MVVPASQWVEIHAWQPFVVMRRSASADSSGMGRTTLLAYRAGDGKNCKWIYRFGANPGMPRGGVLPPTPVLAPGSALGARPRVALSSAQAPPIYSGARPPGNSPRGHSPRYSRSVTLGASPWTPDPASQIPTSSLSRISPGQYPPGPMAPLPAPNLTEARPCATLLSSQNSWR